MEEEDHYADHHNLLAVVGQHPLAHLEAGMEIVEMAVAAAAVEVMILDNSSPPVVRGGRGRLTFNKPFNLSVPKLAACCTTAAIYHPKLCKNLVGASQHSDAADTAWFNKCKANTFEGLSDSGSKRFEKLDLKLAATISKTFKDEDAALTLIQDLQVLDEEI